MEDNHIWKKAMGFDPEYITNLGNILDNAAIKKCELDPLYAVKTNFE